MSEGSRCPPADQLRAVLAGIAAPEEQDRVERHVERCADCRALLDRLALAEGDLRDAPGEHRPDLRAPAPLPRMLWEAIAAAATVSPQTGADAVDPGSLSAVRERLGETIGPYKLLQVIGEGGFGAVYLAEQQTPVVRRVALKVIKLGMDTRQVVARFEAERQALAMMDHPNIARALDAGATDAGRPYFVMELVRGVPITEYCDQHNLTVRQRLELLVPVCQAVQHAHQKGVIHRDLKPTNVLVTLHDGKPVPKVIDFGIAKAISQRLTDKTLYTQFQQMIGTPAYMSPEQAEAGGLDVDTRTDIYSLGVLLYALLTGVTPFDVQALRSVEHHEIQRMIREQDPPPPSTRLSMLQTLPSVATRRKVDPRRLAQLVRGELDWIVMKCLEKDRTRRYDTAEALAADVGRHLTDQPVQAGPPSRMYGLRKLLRRHRGPAIAAAAVTLALVLGMIATTVALLGQRRARAEAERQRQGLAEMIDSLTRDVLARCGPEQMRDARFRERLVALLLQPAAATVEARVRDQPLREVQFRSVLAQSFRVVGRADLGLPHAYQAMRICQQLLGDDHPDTIRSVENYASLLRAPEARDSPLAQNAPSPEALVRDSLDRRRRLQGSDHPDTIDSMGHLAKLLAELGNARQSEALFREALERRRRNSGLEHPETARAIIDLAQFLQAEGRYAEAGPLLLEAVELRRRVFGADYPETIHAQYLYGRCLLNGGNAALAEPTLKQALISAAASLALGPANPATHEYARAYADCLDRLGRYADARAVRQQYRPPLATSP